MRGKSIVSGCVAVVLCLVAACSKENQKQITPLGNLDSKEARAMEFLNQFFRQGESKVDLIRRLGEPSLESSLAGGNTELNYLFREDNLRAANAGVAGAVVIVQAGKVVEWFPIYGSLSPSASMSDRGTAQNPKSLILDKEERAIAFHEVSEVKIEDSKFYDSPEFPKLGYVKNRPSLTAVITRAESVPEFSNETMKAFTLWFREEDRAQLEQLTRDNLGTSIALFSGTQLVAAPYISSPVVDGSVQLTLRAEAFSNSLISR